MQQLVATPEQRAPAERRSFSWRTVVLGFARSRRRGPRRSADGEALFSDWHHPWLFFLALGIMLMSGADAFLTLVLIELGAYEANPLMLSAMQQGAGTFIASKMALTAFGVFALVFLARATLLGQFRAGVLLTWVFSLYACLMCYEFVMLLQLL
jgi:Domain of unknown function (DUF5658)